MPFNVTWALLDRQSNRLDELINIQNHYYNPV